MLQFKPKKKIVEKTTSSPPIFISDAHEKATELVRDGLKDIKRLVGEVSKNSLARVVIAAAEHPLEMTVNLPKFGPEYDLINLLWMIDFAKHTMRMEMVKAEADKLIAENKGVKHE